MSPIGGKFSKESTKLDKRQMKLRWKMKPMKFNVLLQLVKQMSTWQIIKMGIQKLTNIFAQNAPFKKKMNKKRDIMAHNGASLQSHKQAYHPPDMEVATSCLLTLKINCKGVRNKNSSNHVEHGVRKCSCFHQMAFSLIMPMRQIQESWHKVTPPHPHTPSAI